MIPAGPVYKVWSALAVEFAWGVSYPDNDNFIFCVVYEAAGIFWRGSGVSWKRRFFQASCSPEHLGRGLFGEDWHIRLCLLMSTPRVFEIYGRDMAIVSWVSSR